MDDSVEVHIEFQGKTQLVGWCRYYLQNKTSNFEYSQNWLEFGERFALDPANLPLKIVSNHALDLPGVIQDAAPNRWGRKLIQRAMKKEGENGTLSEIDYLLGITDQSRIGALRFKREGKEGFALQIDNYKFPLLLQLSTLLNAALAVESDSESAADLTLLLNKGSSLGGARPKSVVVKRDGTLAIAKFPKPDDERCISKGEVLAMKLAEQSGINVANAELMNVQGHSVALITRFDRQGSQRIPFISAMSLLNYPDQEPATYTEISEFIRRFSHNSVADQHELFRRVVFNVIVGNMDDHLRNHGFLYVQNNQWQLSPAYDLNPIPEHESLRELKTWISEEGPDADLDLARNATDFFALTLKQADEIIDQVNSAAKNWVQLAQQLGMSRNDIDSYSSAFKIAE